MIQAKINNRITPIFGLGYMRSGTTLLFNIIKNHPDVFTRISEPKLFESLPIYHRVYPDLRNYYTLEAYVSYIANVARFGWSMEEFNKPLVEDLDFDEHDLKVVIHRIRVREYVPIINHVYGHMAQKSKKKFWYVKSQVAYFDEIFNWLPEARFLEIIRDPRDMLASKKKDLESISEPGKYSEEVKQFKVLEKAYDPVWDSLSWKAEIAAGMKVKKNHPTIIHSIRYEDLVADPESCTREICKFLRVAYDECLLDVPKRNSSLWQNKPEGIGTQSVEKWKRILTSEEAALCQFLTKRQLNKKNYQIEPIKISWFKIPGLLFKSLAEFFERLKHRKKMGGNKYLRSILNLYWNKFKKLL